MSRIITLSQPKAFQRTAKRSFKIGPISLNFLTIIIICLLALFYLIQSQQSSVKGYQIKDLQEEKQVAIEENEKLQIEAAQLKSIENIKNTADSLEMIPSTELNYLDSQNLTRK